MFPDGRGPDLVHAFTPRENVRRLSEAIVTRYRCPYVVHFEDNEEIVLADELGAEAFAELAALPLALSDAIVRPHRTHPVRGRAFLDGAAGMTALLDTLLEFKPDHVPGTVFWPGLDEALLDTPGDSGALRTELGLDPDEFVLVYTGNIHDSNLAEVRSLYLAVGALRSAGERVTLVKTGWNHVDMSWVDEYGLGEGVRELGFVPRERLWQLLGLADALVQPGGPNAFNDYRFPSKLPDFLASGKPVVLPAANIGRYLRDGVDALVLERGDATEIFAAVAGCWPTPTSAGAWARTAARSPSASCAGAGTWSRSPSSSSRSRTGLRSGRREPRRPRRAASGLAPPAKVIAFYLSQFHHDSRERRWWGEGFTEWTNVAPPSRSSPVTGSRTARRPRLLRPPRRRGPGRPGAPRAGLRDLRLLLLLLLVQRPAHPRAPARDDARAAGAGLPLLLLLGERELDPPVGRGRATTSCSPRTTPPEWAERFIRELLPALADRRYIRVRDEPLLLVYRAT